VAVSVADLFLSKSKCQGHQCALLPICTVATVQLLYTIPILTVTISVHTVTNMYGSHSTVTVYHSNPHCHYISARCYQYVSSHSSVTVYHSNPHCHYISAQLPICTVATVQLLYAIPILTVTISLERKSVV
jgi:hypothetical protein